MIVTILRKTLSSLIIVSLLILLALAIYVSAGRQLLPYVTDYRSDIELRLSDALGQHVQMGSVEAELQRFNPIVRLENVLFFSGTIDEPGPTLPIESISVEIDVFSSLLSRTWIIANVEVNGSDLTLLENEEGRWQLASLSQESTAPFDADALLTLVSRFRNLTLSDASVKIERFDGREDVFDRARIRLQNRADQHFLHLEAWQDDVIGSVSVAAELSGNRVADLTGMLYVLLPNNDYSDVIAGTYFEDFYLARLLGSGEAWVEIDKAAVTSVQGSLALDYIQLSQANSARRTDIEDASMRYKAQRDEQDGSWNVWLTDFGFEWDGQAWSESNFSATVLPGESIDITADHFDLGIAAGIGSYLQVLGERVTAEIEVLNPRGALTNMRLHIGLESDTEPLSLALETNLSSVAVSERKGAPAMWGINGYGDMTFDSQLQQLTGMVEMESSEFMIQLPAMFEEPWAYERVNGRVKYRVDLGQGQRIRLASSVIVAESEIITGRAQFATNFQRTEEDELSSELELIVGVSEGDLAKKSQYLPTGPKVGSNTRSVMQWLDTAIVQGKAVRSGLIYRGSVLQGAIPESKTLQMFYEIEDGSLRFDEQWPSLEQLNGRVTISDRNVDISVDSGQSLDIEFDATTATIRPNEGSSGSMLTVTGRGQGATQQGLNYLQATPVTRGFGRYMADWQSSGEIALNLALSIPLGTPGAKPNVGVALALQQSAIQMPEFALDFTAVNGELYYDSTSGLVAQDMDARLFEQAIKVDLNSTQTQGQGSATQVEIRGSVATDVLRAWPLQSAFVKDVLGRSEGNMEYMARFKIDQQASQNDEPVAPKLSLSIESNLAGVSVDYPQPFSKESAAELPFKIDVEFLEGGQNLTARLYQIASLNIGLVQGKISKGLVFLGAQDEGMSVRRLNANAPGLDVLGDLATFDLEQWSRVLREQQESATAQNSDNFSTLREAVNLIDVNIADAKMFGQSVDSLNVQIQDEPDAWLINLSSEMVAGTVRLPYDAAAGLDVALTHLRLPAPVEPAIDLALDDSVIEKIDPLADFDPSTLPKMRFSADQIWRGEAEFGTWQFDLDPLVDGAELSDLIVSARGVQVGKGGEEARFVWRFANGVHHSYLTAGLTAGDLAPVLSAFGYAPSLNSTEAQFNVSLDWLGSPANFGVSNLSGDVDLRITEGRFLQGGAGGAANGALKLISIINFDALVRRLRFSDDLLRSGLAFETVYGSMTVENGVVQIIDRLQIIGPASLFQVAGSLDLAQQTIDGSLYITLPLSDNIPWMSGIAVLNNLINWQLAVGVFLFDQIFGDQVDSLTSAQYTLKGPWEGLQPELAQVFGTPTNGATGGSRGTNVQDAPVTPPSAVPTDAN